MNCPQILSFSGKLSQNIQNAVGNQCRLLFPESIRQKNSLFPVFPVAVKKNKALFFYINLCFTYQFCTLRNVPNASKIGNI